MRRQYADDRFLITNASAANGWYSLPRDERWNRFLGRAISRVAVGRDSQGELTCPNIAEILQKHFKDFVFVKSTSKDALAARAYEAVESARAHIEYVLAFGCHRMPQELLVSDYLPIKSCAQGYRRSEYRCFIIDHRPATTSLFADHKTKLNYEAINRFAADFASAYRTELPSAYCLDVADTHDGLRVVEMNDIDASGIYADHNLIAFYSALRDLDTSAS